jgi:UDP-N-acetylglucosamine--N-acetylmuramyl-(pentapeptide) pyrophosphoryl-undecaprenol N-acetylglucosamine transferase
MKIIISGGGSGGHIFPAIAIAEALQARRPEAELLFVGALGRMEMEKVPQAGYRIEGLWISGLQRRLTADNLSFPFKVLSSLWKAGRLLREFRPDVAVGTGGYASGPLLYMAARRGIPTLIQEQNAYAGLTNKLLARRVDRICVAFPEMERYFPAEKLVLTGNPVRSVFQGTPPDRAAAAAHFGLDPARPTLLIVGGSQGAGTLNEAIANATEPIRQMGLQVLWQCGAYYADRYRDGASAQLPTVRLLPFVDRMDLAYAAADLVACRSGALTLAELCLLGKPSVLVPSPNVAEDHQTTNARALADRGAAVLLPDDRAVAELLPTVEQLLAAPDRLARVGAAARELAQPDAAATIAEEVLRLMD